MTLLDAPAFDEARSRRRKIVGWSALCTLVILFILWWLVAGRPVDWPWHWNNHLFGRAAVNRFMTDIKNNDLQAAYSVWVHDKHWQEHPQQFSYPFSGPPGRTSFESDWSPTSPDAEYRGGIHSFRIAAARMYGNVLLVAVLVNGATHDALDLTWDPHTGQISYAPPGVRLSTVPFAVVP